MNKNDELNPVTKFITASQSNLEIAAAVYDNYEAGREQILKSFFKKLAKRLTAKHPDWESEYAPALFSERYGRFGIWKRLWKGHYRLVIEGYNWGERMIGGVWRDEFYLKGVPLNPKILPAIKELHNRDKCVSRGYYEAEVTLRFPASDWREPATLWRIHTDPRFLEEVEALFRSWMDIASPILDAAYKKKS